MNFYKPTLFFFSFSLIGLFLLNLRAPQTHKLIQNPGWEEQYNEMKNLVDGLNYYGLRNSWARRDALNKKSSDALNFITEMGPNNVAGRVRALLIDAADSTHIFAGGVSGGLWVSNNGGQTWATVNDQNLSMAVTCITQNPFNPNEIYYGTGEQMNNTIGLDGAGIFKSTDGGKTFSQLPATASLSSFAAIWDIEFSKTDSSTFYVGVANGGLFRTTDNGATFKATYQSSKAIQEIVTYKDSTIWFGLEAYGLIKATEDSIMKFTRFSNGIPTSGIGRISMNYCKRFPNVAYCQMLNTSGNALTGIYKTSNHGLSWKKITSPSSNVYSWAWYCLNTNISSIDTNFVLAISVKSMASTDGGANWTEMSSGHSDFHTSFFYSSGRNFLIGSDGGVYLMNNKTAFSFNISLNQGLNITQFYTGNYNPLNRFEFIGGSQDNGTYYSDGIIESHVLGGDGAYCSFSSTAPYYTYASSQNGEIRRMDLFFNNEVNIKPVGNYSYYFINPFVVNPLDGNQVYILSKTKILASNNAGNSWKELTASLNKTVLSLGISYEKDPTIYFGGGGSALYKCSHAYTLSLNEVDLTATAPILAKGSVINCIKVNHTNPNTIYISMSDINAKPRVWKLNSVESNNPTWINISGNLPASLPVNNVEVNPQDSNVIVAGTDFGMYTTTDGGINWYKETAVPNVPIYKIVTQPNSGVIYIFTHGRGVFRSQFKNYLPTGSIGKNTISAPKVAFNNPIETYLNLTLGDDNKSLNATVQLYNSVGNLVFGNSIGSKSSLDISHISNGIYMMQLTINNSVYNYKILKL